MTAGIRVPSSAGEAAYPPPASAPRSRPTSSVGPPYAPASRNASSTASLSLASAAALAAGTASPPPPRPMSPALMSPPLRATRPLSPEGARGHALGLAHHAPSISVPPSLRTVGEKLPDPNEPPPPEDATVLRQTAHFAGLVLASMLGTLARLGLQAMSRFDGAVIFPLAWAQGVGCGIMGLATARKNQLSWWYPPLFTFISTGICGSITTFSSWMLEGFLAFSDFEGYDRGGFHDTVDGVGYSCATLAISMACLFLGHHMSTILPRLPVRKSDPRRTPLLDCLVVLSAVLAYTAALLVYFLGARRWRHKVMFALLLSPPGAILRFLLARLNTLSPAAGRFPMGTFTANMVATLIVAGVYAAQQQSAARAIPLRCDGLRALQDGFCGCLSTVSTFVVELTTIRRKRWQWTYLWVSVVLGQLFVLAVLGGVKWGQGLGEMCSGTDP